MSQVVVHKRPGVSGLVPEALVLVPRNRNNGPSVIAVHGIQREAAEMADLLVRVVDETGRTVVLPLFDRRHWRRFQLGACPQRSDWALLRLLTALRSDGLIKPGPIDLSGYSGGGQFAHRFAWLYPHLVNRLCVAAPGWWTFADPSIAYPYGIGPGGAPSISACLTANLRQFLDREIVVRVGALDTLRDDKLRVSPELDLQQGLTRVDRAQRWVEHVAAKRVAHGLMPEVDFRILPDCTHSFSDCVAQAGLDRDFVLASSELEPRCLAQSFAKEVARC